MAKIKKKKTAPPVVRKENSYRHNPAHRNKMAGKTQWAASISISTEESIWKNGIQKTWFSEANTVVFGLHKISKKLAYLDSNNRLNFARFKSDSQLEWHGWPANPKERLEDIPPVSVIDSWVNSGFTTRCRAEKVRKLQKCSI
ncbi:hypothetical protein ACNQKP_06925 [Bdellovibrio bacteriovorus]|uniref:hypothetical protein n=1 Tax=Bdellovibrio bacteriovorus TaxID=959 RepID=UPI003AA9263C